VKLKIAYDGTWETFQVNCTTILNHWLCNLEPTRDNQFQKVRLHAASDQTIETINFYLKQQASLLLQFESATSSPMMLFVFPVFSHMKCR